MLSNKYLNSYSYLYKDVGVGKTLSPPGYMCNLLIVSSKTDFSIHFMQHTE